MKKLVVAATGATGSLYPLFLLKEIAKLPDWEAHLVLSPAAALTIRQELGMQKKEFERLAARVYSFRDVGAAIASGSLITEGMVVAPCSMKTLAAIAHGFSENLISRAADVALKERRRLVLLAREAPLHLVHLRNMMAVTEMGGIIFPPVPAFYHRPQDIEEVVAHTIYRVLDLFGVRLGPRWEGIETGGQKP